MRRLIAIENIKTFSSSTFRVILSLHFLFFILVVLSISRIEVSLGHFSIARLYQFPNVWGFFSWVASWFNILLSVLVIVLVCNEYRFFTFRQQIMNGLQERHLLLGKVYMLFVIAVYALLLVVVSGIVAGILSESGGFSLSSLTGFGEVMKYFLQTLAYMSMAMLFAVLLRNNGLTIVIFFLYLFPGEVIIRSLIFPNAKEYFPAKIISDLTPLPSIFSDQTANIQNMGMNMQTLPAKEAAMSSGLHAILVMGYIALFLLITYLLLRRRTL